MNKMKMTKRISCIMIAVAILMLSAISAFAASPAVEQEVLTHNFYAYQIFSADRVDDDHITNVEWGSMFGRLTNANRFLSQIKSSSDFVENGKNIFADCTTADDVARVLNKYADYSDIAKAFAKHASEYAVVAFGNGRTYKNGDSLGEAGYYLFEDASDSSATIINPIILKMAADSKVQIEVKASVPQVEKKVKENTYSNTYNSDTIYVQQGNAVIPFQYENGYNDAADYNIGDLVPFELIGTIPDNFDEFTTYYYSFEDTLCKGLTYDEATADLHVYIYDVRSGKYSRVSDVTSYFTVTAQPQRTTGETFLSVTCNDIIAIRPALTFSSVLVVNYNAVLNENAVIGLNGNLNEVYLEYSNNPSTPTSHGETPTDTVIVFTYEIDVNKYDADHDKKLEGAGFILRSVETGKYYSSKVTPHWVDRLEDAETVYSDANGFFGFEGIDKGNYILTEVEAPDGYKIIDQPIYICVDAKILPDTTHDAAQHWDGTPAHALLSFDADVAQDASYRTAHPSVYDWTATDISTGTGASVTLDVLNTSVYDLPGTGGMGTVIFYVVGGVLVAAAIVLIIVKRKAR